LTQFTAATSYFSNTNSADCNGFTTCVAKPAGCGVGAYSGKASIDSSTGAISIKQDEDAGYTETLCVECANSAGSTVQHDNWNIQQTENCATLTAASLTDQVFDYDASATTTTIYSSSAVILNSKTANCPITTCTLKQSNCVDALVAPFDTLLTIEGSSPWALKISQTQANGYPNVVVCYSCTNSAHTVTN
jgi:hypothetical protein